MARFLAGLNREVQNIVEIQHYVELEDMVHMAMMIENQLKRKVAVNHSAPGTSSWKPSAWKKEEKQPTSNPKPKPEQKLDAGTAGNQGGPGVRNHDIKCFKC